MENGFAQAKQRPRFGIVFRTARTTFKLADSDVELDAQN
jgi:hypothetical protein